MKVLATARPNKQYRWRASLTNIILQARLKNNKISYYEITTGSIHPKRLSVDSVQAMFPTGILITDRPFLVADNRDFYAVLNKHVLKYKEVYRKIKNKR